MDLRVVQADFTLHPHNHMAFIGRTCSGKSFTLLTLLKNHYKIGLNFERCVLFYATFQNIYNDYSKLFKPEHFLMLNSLENIEEKLEEFNSNNESCLIIFDDLLGRNVFANSAVHNLFLYGRHRNFTIAIIMQNIFPSGSSSTVHAREILLQVSSFFLFKMRDLSQIATWSQRTFGKGSNAFILKSYKDAMNKPFSYLYIDLQNHTENKHAVRASVLGETDFQILYDDVRNP